MTSRLRHTACHNSTTQPTARRRAIPRPTDRPTALFAFPWVGQAAERALFVGTPYSDSFGPDSGAVYQYDAGVAGAYFTQTEFIVEVRAHGSTDCGRYGQRALNSQ